MKKKSIFSRLFRGFVVLLIFSLIGLASVLVFGITFPLNGIRNSIEAQFSEALGRKVSIDGDINLVSGLSPSLRLEKLTIGNPSDWPKDGKLASCDRFETTIGVRELLHEKIKLDDITVSGLRLTLEEDTEGRNNWESLTGAGLEETLSLPDSHDDLDFDFTGLEFFTVTGFSVTHRVAGELIDSVFSIESLIGSAPEGAPVRFAISGKLRNLPVDGTFTGGTLRDFLAGAHEWPFDFKIDLHGATIDVEGKISANQFKIPGMLDFSIVVPEVDRLSPLTGLLPFSDPIHLSGRVLRDQADFFRFAELKGEIEETAVSGEVVLDLGGKLPNLEGNLALDTLALGTIANLTDRPSDEGGGEEAMEAGEPAPASLLPFTGKLALQAKEVTGIATTIRDVDLDLAVTETGASAELAVEFAGDPFTGRLAMERLIEPQPVGLEIELEGKDSDVTEIVRYLTGNKQFTGKFETGRYKVAGRGETLAHAWKQRQIDFKVENAEMGWRGNGKEWQFHVEDGSIVRLPNSPGEILVKGTIGDAVSDLRATFYMLEDDMTSRFSKIAGNIADVRFEFQDVSVDNAKAPYHDIQFSIEGARLNQLDSVYDLDLPPVGPYKASGIFRWQSDEIAVDKMDLWIGESHLLGNWRFDRSVTPPKLTGELNAETLQLGEFRGDGWSPIMRSIQTGEAEKAVEKSRRKLLSREILNTYDIDLQLEVGSVLSGSNHLGKGKLNLALESAELRIDPLTVDIPGGHFDGSFRFHPKEDGSLDWNIRIDAERADYGILARRIDPESTMDGTLNLKLDVGASDVPIGAIQLSVASGDLAFNVCPRNVDASKLDTWAISLIRALLPKLDPENRSSLNCVLGKLHLESGIITPESLGLDTTTIRVAAEGQIDLNADTIDLKLTPYSKKPHLFGIEVPVSIRGSLEDPEIGMGKLARTRTIGRMAKNVVLFPLKAIGSARLPEDGSDICACAANYSPVKEDSKKID